MKINKTGLDLYGMTMDDYLYWCKQNNYPYYKNDIKKLFFKLLRDNKIKRDPKTQEIYTIES